MKRLPRTTEIDAKLRASFGADADLTNLVVYEMIAANVNPIRKFSGIYAGARFSEGTLHEMATLINKESRKLLCEHQEGNLPVGRSFNARMEGENLHALFAINSATQPQIVSDLDAGMIDQVSVSVLPTKLLCSECGFDYLAADSSSEHLWTLECPEGHAIGRDGVHVRIVGVDAFTEISLCGMGAVPGARVVGRDQSAFTESAPAQRLAASGKSPTGLLLLASLDKPNKDNTMSKELVESLTAATTKQGELTAQLAAANADLTSARAQVVTLTTERDEARALAAAAPKADEHAKLLAAVTDLTKRSLIATGVQEPTLPTDIAGLLAALEGAQTKLTALLPQGGAVSKGVETQVDASATPAPSNRAFQAQ